LRSSEDSQARSGYRDGPMSRRTRLILVAAVAAAAALGVIGGAALLGGYDEADALPKGVPPFVVDLGVRTGPEAVALRRAARMYRAGERARARQLLAGHQSLQAQVGRALASWPDGSLDRLEGLAEDHPASGAVLFHLGLARFWNGDRDGALAAWREASGRDPDSGYAIRSNDLLFRQFPPGLPSFVPSFGAARSVTSLPPERQLALLERRARSGDVHAKLLYGLALQRIDRPISARRQYSTAARLAPRDPEALVADAVGRFEKAHPERAFSRLGPLTRRFPRAATVRFHVGLLLLWLGRVDEAKRQLRIAAEQKKSPLAREAQRLLSRLEDVRKPQ
jgi:tetratricopeptide (TPR) repeat protein